MELKKYTSIYATMKLGLLVQQVKQKLQVLKNKDVDEQEMNKQERRKTYTASYLHR